MKRLLVLESVFECTVGRKDLPAAEERALFSVNLNKQSSYLNCYLKIITSNAYLISATFCIAAIWSQDYIL